MKQDVQDFLDLSNLQIHMPVQEMSLQGQKERWQRQRHYCNNSWV